MENFISIAIFFREYLKTLVKELNVKMNEPNRNEAQFDES